LKSHDALSIYSTIEKVNKTIIIIQSRVKQFRIGPIRDSAQPMSEHTRFSPLDRLRTAKICQMSNKPALDLFFSRNPRVLTPSRSPLLWQRRQVRDEPPAPPRLWLPDELGEARHRRGRPSAARRRGPRARWLGPIVLPSAIASSAGQRQAARSSSQPLPSYRLREVSRSSYPHLRFFFLPPPVHHGFLICSLHAPRRACFLGAEGVGFRGAAVSLRRTCGWDRAAAAHGSGA